jgi:hypothetical protein
MIRFTGGRAVEVPETEDGTVDVERVRRELGIPPNRALIEQRRDGTNRLLPRRGHVRPAPHSHLMDAPQVVRGGQR